MINRALEYNFQSLILGDLAHLEFNYLLSEADDQVLGLAGIELQVRLRLDCKESLPASFITSPHLA